MSKQCTVHGALGFTRKNLYAGNYSYQRKCKISLCPVHEILWFEKWAFFWN